MRGSCWGHEGVMKVSSSSSPCEGVTHRGGLRPHSSTPTALMPTTRARHRHVTPCLCRSPAKVSDVDKMPHSRHDAVKRRNAASGDDY
eukprot:1195047-Prorocentrum_minimum.AAC.13